MAAQRSKTRTPGVFKRGDRYVVMYRDPLGRQKQESARTYDQARSLKANRDRERADRAFAPEHKVPFEEFAMSWVERYQGKGRRGFREATRDDYRRDLRRYLTPFLDGQLHRTVDEISPRDVSALVAQLPANLADATIRRILSPLRACLGTAVAEGLIAHNPTIGTPLPARDEQRAIDEGRDCDIPEGPRAMSTDQLAAFLLCCPTEWELYFRLLAETGLRVSESFALRWRDLQLDGSEAHVRVRRAYVRGRFGPPKSKYGHRSVPLGNELVVALRGRIKHSEYSSDDDLVFPARNGAPLRQENVRRRVLKPTAEEAGVPWVAFHAFRHTCATLLFSQGRNAVQVQRWLGHHSPAFTLSRYVHLLNEDLGGPLNIGSAPPPSDFASRRKLDLAELEALLDQHRSPLAGDISLTLSSGSAHLSEADLGSPRDFQPTPSHRQRRSSR